MRKFNQVIVIDIDLLRLRDELETMSLCHRFFSTSAGKINEHFPVADKGHSALLGVFWQQTVTRVAALLSGWSLSTVDYGSGEYPTALHFEFRRGMDFNDACMKELISSLLTQIMIGKVAEAAGFTEIRCSSAAETDGLIDSIICMLL